MATTPSAALVPAAPVFTNTERLALGGYLAGYSGLTRQAYELDLRQYASWCQQHHLRLFGARRADITSTDELPRDATKREQHKPHEPPICTAVGRLQFGRNELQIRGFGVAGQFRRGMRFAGAS
jgi:hypothetical protein